MTVEQAVQDELATMLTIYQAWLMASEGLSGDAKGRVVSWLIDKINSDHRNSVSIPAAVKSHGTH